MQLSRTSLIETIEIVSPALSDNNLIPILTHLCFDGKRVMAYNDQIALSAPLETDFKGAVPGEVLLKLLKNSIAPQVELSPGNNNLLVKMGVSKVKLGLLPPTSFIFDFPDIGDGAIKNSAALIQGVEGCLPSIGNDMTIPDLAGVTIIPGKSELCLYACNTKSLSRAKIKDVKVKARVILSRPFCDQFLKLAKKAEKWSMQLTADHAMLKADDVILFGRLLQTDAPQNFEEMIEDTFPQSAQKKKMVELNKTLRRSLQFALERATIMASKIEQTKTKIDITDGRIKFYSKSERGEINENIKIEGHPDASVELEAKMMKVGIDFADEILITDQCAVMAKDNLLYLVAAAEDQN